MNRNRITRKWALTLTTLLLTAVLAACGSSTTPEAGKDDPSRPDGVVTGIITTSAGEPLKNAPVTLQEYTLESSILRVQSSSFTDEHGQFGLGLNKPGTYALQATGDSEGVFQLITVSSEDGQLVAQDLELTAAEYGMVTITVHDPDGAPAADSLVYLAGTNHIGMTNAAGSTTLTRVPAGTYTALATSDDHGRSDGLTVTVKSAETATVGPLELKSLTPLIHSISPNPYLSTWNDLGRITITGENFGDERGLSKVHFGNWHGDGKYMRDIEVTDAVVKSWSDTEITLEGIYFDPEERLFDDPTVTSVWNRLQIVTTAGISNLSDPVESIRSFIEIVDPTGTGYQSAHVISPTEPLDFLVTVTGSTEVLINEAGVTFEVTTGTFTQGGLSEVEEVEEEWWTPGVTRLSREAYINLEYTPTAAEAGDTFAITTFLNGTEAIIYTCTLYEGVDWTPTDWTWECVHGQPL